MGSTDKTPELDLSQFADGDKPTWTGDYNRDMRQIEGGQKTIKDALTAANNNMAVLLTDTYRKNEVVGLLDARDVTDEQTYAKKTDLTTYAKTADVAAKTHTHTASQVTDFSTAADARIALALAGLPAVTTVLRGTYANRPPYTDSPLNSLYLCTDIPEMYVRGTGSWTPIGSGGNTIAKAIIASDFAQTANPGTYQDISGLSLTAKIGERPVVVSFDGNVAITNSVVTAAKHPVIIRITVNGTAVAQASHYFETNNSFGATAHIHLEAEISGYAAGSALVVKAQIATANGEGASTGKGLIDAGSGLPAMLKVATA